MLDFLPVFPRTVIAFVVVLGVLVFVHELGHYLAARWRGVHVETFSIGFGKALVSWTDRRGTAWKVGWMPLGGYVKLHGQERPEDVSPEVRAGWIAGRIFHEKPVGSRAIVVAAGPVANFLLAVLLYFALYAALGQPVGGQPTVGDVVAGSAAAHAGLQVGDRITGIDDQAVAKFEDIQRIVVPSAGKTLLLHIKRGDATLDLTAVPEDQVDGDGNHAGKLGIRGGTIFEPVSLPRAMVAAVEQTWTITTRMLEGIWSMIMHHRSGDEFGGPLRIAQMSGEVAANGFPALVEWIALLSVNLGLLNLFPIPVLDGGHLMFFLAEAVRGRPLPPRAQEYGFRAGFALLIGLVAFATWNDLAHIGLFKWVAALIG